MFKKTLLEPSLRQYTPEEYRQHMILIAVAPFGAFIFALLALHDAFVIEKMDIAYIPAVLSIGFFVAFTHYKVTKNPMLGISIILITAIGVLLTFTFQNQNQSFGLVWAILYPTLIIMSIGHYWGLRLTVIMYICLLAILYSGLNVWQEGSWDLTGLIRFTLAYFATTFMVYVLSSSSKHSYQLLEKKHIKQIAKHKIVEKIAKTDSLTGVFNRYHLNQTMKNLPLNDLNQQNTNMVFFILQINWFKYYVDYYGFEKGDELLLTVSELITRQMKPINGHVFRVAGSQFAGYSLAQDITKTLQQINEIEKQINELAIPHILSPEKVVSASTGIVVHNQFTDFDFDVLYKQTDKALFQALENPNHKMIILDQRLA